MNAVAEKPATEEKRVVILDPQLMKQAAYVRQDHVVNAPEGTTVEDVLRPEFWAHKAAEMQVYDRVDVRLETGEWFLEMLVLRVGRNYAQVHLLHRHDLVPIDHGAITASDRYEAKFKGPQKKWCAIRRADNAVLQDGFEDRASTQVWINNYERTTGA